MQMRIRRGMLSQDYCPTINDLPEGLSGDVFQTEYGGLGGARTKAIVQEIQRRLANCTALAPIEGDSIL